MNDRTRRVQELRRSNAATPVPSRRRELDEQADVAEQLSEGVQYPISEEDAQEIHDLAIGSDPTHDRSSCWCCCLDCDFDHQQVNP